MHGIGRKAASLEKVVFTGGLCQWHGGSIRIKRFRDRDFTFPMCFCRGIDIEWLLQDAAVEW